MSSIAIIGKGKSVLRCAKKYIDSFDNIAFINLLRISGFEDYISNRCDYLFLATNGKLGYMARDKRISWQSNQLWDDREYYINNTLGIKNIFNLSTHPENDISKFLDSNIKYDFTFRRRTLQENSWENPNLPEKNWYPPAGLTALEYFINHNYEKISLVGFDFYQVGAGLDEKDIHNHYYFLDKDNKNETQINVDGKDPNHIQYNNSEFVPHEPEKQIDYIITQVKQNPNIEFEIYTNCSKLKEQKFNNLKVL